jgi:hypothetical protein
MTWTNSTQDENRFWLQVMGDKARLIDDKLDSDDGHRLGNCLDAQFIFKFHPSD